MAKCDSSSRTFLPWCPVPLVAAIYLGSGRSVPSNPCHSQLSWRSKSMGSSGWNSKPWQKWTHLMAFNCGACKVSWLTPYRLYRVVTLLRMSQFHTPKACRLPDAGCDVRINVHKPPSKICRNPITISLKHAWVNDLTSVSLSLSLSLCLSLSLSLFHSVVLHVTPGMGESRVLAFEYLDTTWRSWRFETNNQFSPVASLVRHFVQLPLATFKEISWVLMWGDFPDAGAEEAGGRISWAKGTKSLCALRIAYLMITGMVYAHVNLHGQSSWQTLGDNDLWIMGVETTHHGNSSLHSASRKSTKTTPQWTFLSLISIYFNGFHQPKPGALMISVQLRGRAAQCFVLQILPDLLAPRSQRHTSGAKRMELMRVTCCIAKCPQNQA